jgi:hypothetical protein
MGGYNKAISGQRPVKHVPAATDRNVTTELSMWSVPRCYGQPSVSSVESRSNTATVALRVVGGDEKGSAKSETVKYGCQSHGTRTRE